ncbi:L,D-transpeptidase family protein [Hymenobacter pini]|uniref:L,D-transpeptidase family protein n=1 Tax=Hymenobacter pini TaxID=2880879 RepID=UPI001CF5878B|nr:L,D-transpeptidase family protein [Hymenobacter pini]MCA8830264.1 L,D-transpeptidase family protein [Hymenobacter pini]
MDWLRSTLRLVLALCTLLSCGSALPLLAAPRVALAPEAESTAAQQSVRVLLANPATDAKLGLQAGQVVRLFYARHEYRTHWVQPAGWNEPAQSALAVLERAADVGLDRRRYAWAVLRALPDSLLQVRGAARSELLAVSEVRLTDALLHYLQHVRYGQLEPNTLLPAAAPDSSRAELLTRQLQEILTTSNLPAALHAYQPGSRTYLRLQAAWQRALHASPADSSRLMQDTTGGFRRVALNLERLRWQVPADTEYAVVNIPAFHLQLVRNGQVVQTHRAIVGKPETPTPVLSGRIVVFVTAPEWRVPYSIAVREFLPELQRDPSYLYDNHYRLYDWQGKLKNPWRVDWQRVTPQKFPYTIRQKAGSYNALGNVVFYFPNQQTVFLHDTPAQSAFTRTDRALSHGCIRIEKPLKLADYLLRREGRAKELPTFYQSIRTHEKHRFDLRSGLPIYLGYYTCEVENGKIVFFPDIYQQDYPLAQALFEK